MGVPNPTIFPVGISSVGDQVSSEEINVDPFQAYSSSGQALLHKYFSIKAPKTAPQFEGGELQVHEGVPAQYGEAWTAQGQEVARAARIEGAKIGGIR